MLPRMALGMLSVVAIAWLALMLRAELINQDVAPRLTGAAQRSAGEFRDDIERVDSSRLLNPDPTPRFVRAAAWLTRDPGRAVRELDSLAREEPDNVAVWRVLYATTRDFDPGRADQAAAQIRRLDPRAGP